MKKILALMLSSLIVLGGTGVAVSATTSGAPKAQEQQNNLYLVPGTYISGGKKVENTISSGATKLSSEECAEIYTENAYVCTLSTGTALPAPSSARVDKEGNAYSFNGWWTIVDATVTYFDKVPKLSEDTYLYADWRADLSQRMDPVEPDPEVVVEPNHYLIIKHAEKIDGKSEEKIVLRQSSTDVSSAMDLGYGHPVQLSTQLTLLPGDSFIVYTTGLTNSEKPVKAPYADKNSTTRYFQFEANGTGTNDTANYLGLGANADNYRVDPVIMYLAESSGTFNIYLKFFSGGNTMAVYMEPAAV